MHCLLNLLQPRCEVIDMQNWAPAAFWHHSPSQTLLTGLSSCAAGDGGADMSGPPPVHAFSNMRQLHSLDAVVCTRQWAMYSLVHDLGYLSASTTCCRRSRTYSSARGGKRKRVHRDCRAGMILLT